MGDGVRVPRQEQEEAQPEVTELAPGVLRMQLPVSMPGIGHVNMYALVDDRGIALVDPGMPGPATWKAIQARMKSAGLPLERVHTILVTHSHPDHFGGVAAVAKETGAKLVTHSAFRAWFRPHDHGDEPLVVHDVDPEDLPEIRRMGGPAAGPAGRAAMRGMREPGPNGRPGMASGAARQGRGRPTPWAPQPPWQDTAPDPAEMRRLRRQQMRQIPLRRRMQVRVMRTFFRSRMVANRMAPPPPAERLKNGDVLRLAGREWQALHTPGHTLDHLCLYDPEEGVLLSGDHVLPTITPHIAGVNSGRDPLGLFEQSLDKVAALEGVQLVLPAHGHPFPDLQARVQSIKDHHEERLSFIAEISAELGAATVEQYSQRLFRPERWGHAAESETYAHLEHLRLKGDAERQERDGLVLYEIAAPSRRTSPVS